RMPHARFGSNRSPVHGRPSRRTNPHPTFSPCVLRIALRKTANAVTALRLRRAPSAQRPALSSLQGNLVGSALAKRRAGALLLAWREAWQRFNPSHFDERTSNTLPTHLNLRQSSVPMVLPNPLPILVNRLSVRPLAHVAFGAETPSPARRRCFFYTSYL